MALNSGVNAAVSLQRTIHRRAHPTQQFSQVESEPREKSFTRPLRAVGRGTVRDPRHARTRRLDQEVHEGLFDAALQNSAGLQPRVDDPGVARLSHDQHRNHAVIREGVRQPDLRVQTVRVAANFASAPASWRRAARLNWFVLTTSCAIRGCGGIDGLDSPGHLQ